MILEKLYTVREAGALDWLRLKEWTLWAMLKDGRLLRTKVGGKTLIRESELRKLISDSGNEPKPEPVMVETRGPARKAEDRA